MKSNIYSSNTFFLALLFLVFTQVVNAQNFTEVLGTPFDGVDEGSVAFADVDGDGDQDVLITGFTIGNRIAKLYTNDGFGNYSEVSGTPFEGVAGSSIAFADVDGDNDQDVVITGSINTQPGFITDMYINDSSGVFTEVVNIPLQGMAYGSIAFADVDCDNDQDVLLTGHDQFFNYSMLYTNDGLGNFTQVMNTPFNDVSLSSVAFADVDSDNDQDVLITGQDFSGIPISTLYINDGLGGFTEMMNTPFVGLRYSSIAFADVDGDNDQDVLITGQDDSAGYNSVLYNNDGSGGFTEMTGTPFEGVYDGSIAFADVDDDNDLDLLIAGRSDSGLISNLYTNDGSGNFTEVIATPFDGVRYASVAFTDVDGDSDQDLLITGMNNSFVNIAKLYLNDGILSSSNDLFADVNLDLTLLPNPAISSKLNVRFESTESNDVIIRVFDLRGNLISQQNEFAGIGEQSLVVDIANLSSGTYLIQMENGEKLSMAKFIVQ